MLTGLNQIGISIKQLTPHANTKLQRYQLLKERFTELIAGLGCNEEKSIEFNNVENWRNRFLGQGVLPPSTAASIECETLEKRWQNLQSTLLNLGPLSKQMSPFNDGYEEILWAGDFVIVVEIGKLKSRGVMRGWVNHLIVCASDKTPSKTLVIARSSSKSKKDLFEIPIKWGPLTKRQAAQELNKLRCLAMQGVKYCWPVPPESGWAFIKASHTDPLKGEMAFKRSWNGSFNNLGERDAPEMKLCFGTNFEVENFLTNKTFKEACSLLYKPIIEFLSN